MRVRTAEVKVLKATGLASLFHLAVERHLAWVQGRGRIYADLEKVAGKNGYRVWSFEAEEGDDTALWFAVREDLIAEDGWDASEVSLSFEATREGLGTVGLVGDSLFDNRASVTLLQKHKPVERDDLTYTEVLYSAQPLKN